MSPVHKLSWHTSINITNQSTPVITNVTVLTTNTDFTAVGEYVLYMQTG